MVFGRMDGGGTVIIPSLGQKKIAWKLSMNYPSGRNERRLPSFVPRTSKRESLERGDVSSQRRRARFTAACLH